MSCNTGDKSCETPRRRGAFVVMLLMTGIFILLSIFSFLDSRGQVTPDQITYNHFRADEGKRIFQAYNCMGCHTIVGNGAYFGPDLTKIYRDMGPAWLEAFLPSAGSWPTAAAVRTHLVTPQQLAAADVSSFDDYLAKYPGAAERIQRRGGQASHMPNLPFRTDEPSKLIAFFKYTSAMHNEGWPPAIKTGRLEQRLALAYSAPAVAQAATLPTATDTQVNLVQQGEKLVTDYGCLACHATDASRKIGPGWGDLYGHNVDLADGNQVAADRAYLVESILKPNAKVVSGFPAGVMPAYDSLLQPEEVNAMVAFLVSLSKAGE